MNNVNWEKYNTETLEFILNESSILLEETFQSFRESANKSYIALGFYVGLFSYCIEKVSRQHISWADLPFLLLAVGLIISAFLLWSNIMPGVMTFRGTKPAMLLGPYYEQKEKKQERYREMLINRLKDQNDAISKNVQKAQDRGKMFQRSVLTAVGSLLLCFVIVVVGMCRN